MDEMTQMMAAALLKETEPTLPEEQTPPVPVQEVLPPEPTQAAAPHDSSRGETVDKILLFCGLREKLAQSACLRCQNSVLAMSNRPAATLYCKALYRDLEVCITDCTCFTPV